MKNQISFSIVAGILLATAVSVQAEGYEYRMPIKGLKQSATEEALTGDHLKVISPSEANGIYMINTGDQGVFPAYVNMEIEGGPWVLVARWRDNIPEIIYASEVVAKGNALRTTTNDATNFPVLPTGVINTAHQALFVSGRTDWINNYGAWQRFDLFPPGYIFTSNGFSVATPSGQTTMYAYDVAWGRSPGLHQTAFSLWPVPDASGPCGGSGMIGSNQICPILARTIAGHFDWTSQKMLFIKGEL